MATHGGPKSKTKTKTTAASSKSRPRPNPTTRKTGLYRNDEKQCAEITTQYGRCKLHAETGTMFCKLHQRRPHGHEDEFFDSTFSCVYGNVWIGSLDTTNDPKALKAAGIRNIVNISGWEPKPKTRDMYRRLGINYHTLTHRDKNGHVQFLGDEPIRNVNNFYWYMDKGVNIMRGLRGTTLVNCFAEDHQLLTNKGFMFLHEIEQQIDDNTLIAGYNPETDQIVYEKFELVVNPEMEQTMIEFMNNNEARRWSDESDVYGDVSSDDRLNPSNGVSLLTTPGHEMYVKYGLAQKGSTGVYWKSHKVWIDKDKNKYTYEQNPYVKVKAGELVSTNERDCVKFLGCARSGIEQKTELPEALCAIGLSANSDQLRAFLELYGYWLGDGSLSFKTPNGGRDGLSFHPSKIEDQTWLEQRFSTMGLNVSSHDCKVGKLYYVYDDTLTHMYHSEYESKYLNGDQYGSIEPKSGKWFMPWVWELNKDEVRSVFVGLRMADGDEANNENAIYTSSVKFRDELMRLALHGGYSPFFVLKYRKGSYRGTRNGVDIIAQHDSWRVSYNEGVQQSEPNLRSKRDIKKVPYYGKTWCVTVPHHFVIARRAHFDNTQGFITKASKPIICSNCHAGVNRSASLVASYLMAVHKMPYERAEALLKRANAKRRVPCLTNRYFVAALKRYPEHLREMAVRRMTQAKQ